MFTPQPYPLYVAHPGDPTKYLTAGEREGPNVYAGLIVGWEVTNADTRPVVMDLGQYGEVTAPELDWWEDSNDNHVAPNLAHAVQLAVGSALRDMVELAGGSPLRLAQYASVCWAAGAAARPPTFVTTAVNAAVVAPVAASAWIWAHDRLLSEIGRVPGGPVTDTAGGVALVRLPLALTGLHRGQHLDDEHGLPEDLGQVVVVDGSQPEAGVLAVANVRQRPRYVTLVGQP